MGEPDFLTTRATQLLALALKAKREGLSDYADALVSKAQAELEAAIELVDQLTHDKAIQDQPALKDDYESGY